MTDAEVRVTVPMLLEGVIRLEKAVRALASDPGQPHHAAEQALDALDGEDY